jgi:hypothetical protein
MASRNAVNAEMTFDQFMASLGEPRPPGGLSAAVSALWWMAQGDWKQAHLLVNDRNGADDAWVHAHLHRVEGDQANAAYWYRHAGKKPSTAPLETERETIAKALLAAER